MRVLETLPLLPPAVPVQFELPAVHPAVWSDVASVTLVAEPGLFAEPTPLSFVRQAQRKAFWRRTGVRVMLALLVFLLTLLLALQWAVMERDRLSATQPALTPWLQRLCQPLACTLQPWRHLEFVVLDSSALRRREPGLYAFEAVIKNTSSQTLAVPALELSLTDASDAVLVRRVFLPTQWPEPALTLPPKSEWPLRLELALDGPDVNAMTGFRALLFYP